MNNVDFSASRSVLRTVEIQRCEVPAVSNIRTKFKYHSCNGFSHFWPGDTIKALNISKTDILHIMFSLTYKKMMSTTFYIKELLWISLVTIFYQLPFCEPWWWANYSSSVTIFLGKSPTSRWFLRINFPAFLMILNKCERDQLLWDSSDTDLSVTQFHNDMLHSFLMNSKLYRNIYFINSKTLLNCSMHSVLILTMHQRNVLIWSMITEHTQLTFTTGFGM